MKYFEIFNPISLQSPIIAFKNIYNISIIAGVCEIFQMAKHAVYFSLVFFAYLFPTRGITLTLEQFGNTCIVTGAGVLVSTVMFSWHATLPWTEKCGHSWQNFNASALDDFFKQHLFGQHLVSSTVPNVIEAHILNKDSHKALVMSFHGWTGTGKTYVANIIAQALFDKGSKSEFVHWYVATRDFPLAGHANKYRERLQHEIQVHTKKCGQTLFIFDEVEKLTPGVIDVLSTFINLDDGDIDYRKNIFIFLGNTGGRDITKVAFNFWLDGKDREDMTMKDVEPLVLKSALYENGGLQYSELVKKNLVDVFIPFLPLERNHVKNCIIHELKMRKLNISQHIVQKVANQVMYYPPQFQSFSVSGCKKLTHKIDLYI